MAESLLSAKTNVQTITCSWYTTSTSLLTIIAMNIAIAILFDISTKFGHQRVKD